MTRSLMHIVILGNSAAGLNALESFRRFNSTSRVSLVSAEAGPAYSKVLLPYYLRRRIKFSGLFIRRPEDYQRLNVHTFFNNHARKVDFNQHTVTLDSGEALYYDQLLVATGATPSDPPIVGLQGPGVHHLWTLQDVLNIDPLFQPGKKVVFIGSGLVCLQGAWAACCRGLKVEVVECMDRILPQLLDKQGSEILSASIVKNDVRLRLGICADAVERRRNGSMRLFFKDHPPIDTDLIIVGTGVRSNTSFLQNGINKWVKGIPVGQGMETEVKGVYAAGDVALAHTVFDEPHVFTALWPTAVEQGEVAGANMAGQHVTYQGSLSMNITEMFGVTIASIGQLKSKQENGVWVKPDLEKNNRDSHFQVVMGNGVPIGGLSVGAAEDAQLLGFLKMLILNKREIENIDDVLRKRDLYSYGSGRN